MVVYYISKKIEIYIWTGGTKKSGVAGWEINHFKRRNGTENCSISMDHGGVGPEEIRASAMRNSGNLFVLK
jgi:hypothetical protein